MKKELFFLLGTAGIAWYWIVINDGVGNFIAFGLWILMLIWLQD